ncbi:glycoside hydrolase family 55 protein [Trichodelitschia bisporula]|uniref:Glycoside hydrolase family 55 protein n=1 Tax=Trichodelitschia bisporula TaxID=703511 RepID=A0A6G1HKB0_9PEZI|nr:glycoside hydrolase family 55 protein [Trichodelitschia bisporula]
MRLSIFAPLALFLSALVSAAPIDGLIARDTTTSYWVSSIARQGKAAFGDPAYQIFRNVRDCGAKGDGQTDDTAAINTCITMGSSPRCAQGCDSTTVTPAIVYFPPGVYVVSKPIVQLYYTQFVGDASSPPTLKAAPSFTGIAIIDSDPYDNFGNNWYTNQNNFFRQVRNFVIDLTAMPGDRGAGIHWQVAQATSLQNIRFEMVPGATAQQGVFMDNGSGGFMTDLTFNGGNMGMFLGNQQFTTRNLTFNGCRTAIFMNWNWVWTFKDVAINNCNLGIDMANNPPNQTVGSVLLQDAVFTNTDVAFNTSFNMQSVPSGGGTLVLDNVDFGGARVAVQSFDGQTIMPGGSKVQTWVQGRTYAGSDGTRTQGMVPAAAKPSPLLTADGRVFARSKPQYLDVPVSNFVSVKAAGAKGDGQTDDTGAIQAALNALQPGQVLYFDHGAYIITSTVRVPAHAKITGEIWPVILASGAAFSDPSNPQPVFLIGTPNDNGAVEMSDMIFATAGPAPGAILMEWASGASSQGSNGLWDVHFRLGGAAGTQLQADKCAKNPGAQHGPNSACIGAHTLFHTLPSASVYVENCWFWVADHELDQAGHSQIDLYNGRGVHIESQQPVWLVGTAAEHSQLYNYQLRNAKNVYFATAQTETPYMQGNPPAPGPWTPDSRIGDPTFGSSVDRDNRAWGLRIVDSSDVVLFGGGLYSFFDNYDQVCVGEQNCQNRIISVEGTVSGLELYGLSTKASVSMVSTEGNGFTVADADNRSNFCATLGMWRPE